MYGREYDGKELNFEPSGGLLHAALVLQDKETDSYWSIMTGKSLSGPFKGTGLNELPRGVKAQWKDWAAQHPDTLVLSVDGVEHIENNPYDNYFTSDEGFRKMEAGDDRLATKTSVYTFQLDGTAYAVPFSAFETGQTFDTGESTIFLYRPPDVAVFYSTIAYIADAGKFEMRNGAWVHRPSGATFDTETGGFGEGATGLRRFEGFDTFWYMWSLTNPETVILEK